MRKVGTWVAAMLLGCGGAPPPAASSPPASASAASEGTAGAPAAPPSDPFAVRGALHEEAISDAGYTPIATPLGAAPKGLAPPPPLCAAFVSRKKAGKLACKDGLVALDRALVEADAAKKDALLVDLDACAELPKGLVSALRAEHAPLGCADAMVGALVGKAGPSPEIAHALAGLAVAARLSRTGARAPVLAPPYDKDRVLGFIKGPLNVWIATQAKLIEELSQQAAQLRGYGKGVAAIESGLADLRFVDVVRAVPVPDSFANDAELRGVYEASLDQLLDPRKERGRDAALVGLKELAAVGVIRDGRITRARALLGRMYAGRRIDALDGLMLPPPPADAKPPEAPHDLARNLPTFYVPLVLDPKSLTDKNSLTSLLSRGMPSAVRAQLKAEPPAGEAAAIVARARLDLGRTYWRAVDFDEAAAAANVARGAKARDADLLLALALALRGGPEDAAQMMKKPPPEGLGIGDVAALDAIRGATGPTSCIAAFDAAWIKRVSAPRAPSAQHWVEVAARFRDAAICFQDDASRKRANDAAGEADAIAAEAAKATIPPPKP